MSTGSWWDDFTGVFTQGLSGANIGSTLATGLAGLAVKEFGLSDHDIPVVGYQGGIPEYQAVSERVPMPSHRKSMKSTRNIIEHMTLAQANIF